MLCAAEASKLRVLRPDPKLHSNCAVLACAIQWICRPAPASRALVRPSSRNSPNPPALGDGRGAAFAGVGDQVLDAECSTRQARAQAVPELAQNSPAAGSLPARQGADDALVVARLGSAKARAPELPKGASIALRQRPGIDVRAVRRRRGRHRRRDLACGLVQPTLRQAALVQPQLSGYRALVADQPFMDVAVVDADTVRNRAGVDRAAQPSSGPAAQRHSALPRRGSWG